MTRSQWHGTSLHHLFKPSQKEEGLKRSRIHATGGRTMAWIQSLAGPTGSLSEQEDVSQE
jgi:hypothetical protein